MQYVSGTGNLFRRTRNLLQTEIEIDGTTHQPNCSAITNDELAATIDGVWTSNNGKVEINYVFSLPAFYWLLSPNFTTFHLRNLDFATTNAFQSTVRTILSKYMDLNNGILTFTEVASSFKTNFNPFFRGIFYAQAATEAQFSNDGEGAFTVLRFDNNGYIRQGIIYMPSDITIYTQLADWDPYDWINQTVSHETSHTLGGNHLQNYADILAKLQNTPDGVFCSVMDYYNLISTSISECKQNCTPAFAIYPGDLDIRSIQQAYLYDNYDHGYDKTAYYIINALELVMLFGAITLAYTSVDNYLCSLEYRKDKPFIPKRLIQSLFNLALLVLFIEMGAPDVIPIAFGISALLRAIPEAILNKSSFYRNHSQLFNFVLDSRLPLYVLATSTVFAEGVLPEALSFAAFFTGSTLFLSTLVGLLPEYLLKERTNKKLQQLANHYFPEQVVMEEGVEMAQIAAAVQQAAVPDVPAPVAPPLNDNLTISIFREEKQFEVPNIITDRRSPSPALSPLSSPLLSPVISSPTSRKKPDTPISIQSLFSFFNIKTPTSASPSLTEPEIDKMRFNWNALI